MVLAEGASPEPEGASPEVTSWQPEVAWFGVGHRGPVGKKERGLRSDKERTGRDVDMTSLLARVGNRGPQAGKTAGAGQTKEDAMLEKITFFNFFFFYKSPKSKRLIVGGLGPREEEEEVLYVVGVPSTAPIIHFICYECSISF